MAGFFNLPSARATTKKDQALLKKASAPVKSSAVTLKGSGKLIDRIASITSFVKSKFDGKEDELELITTEEHLIKYIDKCIENNIISIDNIKTQNLTSLPISLFHSKSIRLFRIVRIALHCALVREKQSVCASEF